MSAAEQNHPTTAERILEKTLPVINELLPGCSPLGAYCLGLVHSLAIREGIEPSRELLERASRCQLSKKEVEDLYRLWGLREPEREEWIVRKETALVSFPVGS